MTTRDYNFKNTVSICPDCSKKIFYRHKHDCIKYEPCSMEEQIICDELDDKNNSSKTLLDFVPKKYIPSVDFVFEDETPESPKKSYEKFLCPCGVFINDFSKDNHELTTRHKKKIKMLNKC